MRSRSRRGAHFSSKTRDSHATIGVANLTVTVILSLIHYQASLPPFLEFQTICRGHPKFSSGIAKLGSGADACVRSASASMPPALREFLMKQERAVKQAQEQHACPKRIQLWSRIAHGHGSSGQNSLKKA